VTHLTTTVFLYQKHHTDDGQITGWNICWWKYHK